MNQPAPFSEPFRPLKTLVFDCQTLKVSGKEYLIRSDPTTDYLLMTDLAALPDHNGEPLSHNYRPRYFSQHFPGDRHVAVLNSRWGCEAYYRTGLFFGQVQGPAVLVHPYIAQAMMYLWLPDLAMAFSHWVSHLFPALMSPKALVEHYKSKPFEHVWRAYHMPARSNHAALIDHVLNQTGIYIGADSRWHRSVVLIPPEDAKRAQKIRKALRAAGYQYFVMIPATSRKSCHGSRNMGTWERPYDSLTHTAMLNLIGEYNQKQGAKNAI